LISINPFNLIKIIAELLSGTKTDFLFLDRVRNKQMDELSRDFMNSEYTQGGSTKRLCGFIKGGCTRERDKQYCDVKVQMDNNNVINLEISEL
jgi:hypothetical protein